MTAPPPPSCQATVLLRSVADTDLPIFFQQQLDPAANQMAAFTRKDPADRDAFDAHWRKIRADEQVTIRTIIHDRTVAGSIACYGPADEKEVTYWLGREFWGKGIATAALRQFLLEFPPRPLFARAASDNTASIRVLEKCGFAFRGRDKFFANARGKEIDEVILRLDQKNAVSGEGIGACTNFKSGCPVRGKATSPPASSSPSRLRP